jgi:hypothetical protein
MPHKFRHIILPALAPAAFLLVAAIPVEVLGCFTRGLMALTVAMISVIGGALAVKGHLAVAGRPNAHWWTSQRADLAIPAALFVLDDINCDMLRSKVLGIVRAFNEQWLTKAQQ